MSANPDINPFANMVGETFHVGTPPYNITAPVKLESANHQYDPLSGTETLSLSFTGPMEPFIAQGIYVIMHSRLPPQAYFIVPVGQTPGGYQYQVLVNHNRLTASEISFKEPQYV